VKREYEEEEEEEEVPTYPRAFVDDVKHVGAQAPIHGVDDPLHHADALRAHGQHDVQHKPRALGARDVALQVAFERQTLKPVFSLDRL
jgi:hypothetical protein